MSRLVIVSFAFLGWGFYEFSGGGDFVAPERPPENLLEVASTSATLDTPTPAASTFQRSAKIRAATLVTAPVLQPGLQQAAASPSQSEPNSRPRPDPAHRQAVALDKIASAGASLHSSASAFARTAETGLLHMDNIQGGLAAMTTRPAAGGNLGGTNGGVVLNTGLTSAEPAQPLIPVESYLHIREIRASRVNMRQGPGTNYSVLTRLLADDKVRVLEDSGTGWLRLKVDSTGRIGWIAASLLTKKAP